MSGPVGALDVADFGQRGLIDAVVGVDTHRDTHHAEIASRSGTPIATLQISNDSARYAPLQAWIAQHAAGPRLAVSVEGTRSYGLGLTRALAAAGLDALLSGL